MNTGAIIFLAVLSAMLTGIFMGLFDAITGKKEDKEKESEERASEPAGKFDEECSVCGGRGTDKKWMGQYWHKKCLRAVKKGARKMI